MKLDRLTRPVRDLGNLVERYFTTGTFSLLSVGEQIDTRSAAGRLVLSVLASVAQWEREATGERTSTALRHKAARGEFTGGRVPFGFGLAGNGTELVAIAEEQRTIAVTRKLRAHGCSQRTIAKHLSKRGYRSRSGKTFAPVQISRMLSRAA